MSQTSWSADEVPSALDHILLGCSDLGAGISLLEKHTGVHAGIGGVHPGRGTRNALLSLGTRRYLEIIAPDPVQSNVSLALVNSLRAMAAPSLVGWAAHVSDINAVAAKLRASGMKFEGPDPGSRKRPDGHILKWTTVDLDDTRDGLLPFFIEWGAETVHPSVDAASGCRLERFAAADPDPAELARVFQQLGVDVPVERAAKRELRVKIAGPKGTLSL